VEAKERITPRLFERIVDPLRRVLSGSGKIESAYTRTVDGPLNDAEYISALEAVIRELALELNMVIVGRGSQYILRNNRSVLHVLVVAPIEERLGRVMADMQIERQEAMRHIEENDASRRAFVERFFHKELEDPLLYDLVLNTKYITFEVAARLITNAAAEKNPWR
jgi:cytidylate kinase